MLCALSLEPPKDVRSPGGLIARTGAARAAAATEGRDGTRRIGSCPERKPTHGSRAHHGLRRPIEYDAAVTDLVSFMTWMSEPVQTKRRQLGVWVLLFLGLLSVLAWRLNASYWKEVK